MAALSYIPIPKYQCPLCKREINGSEWAYTCSHCNLTGGRTIGVRQKANKAKKAKR